jgi:hypothetical protein
MTHNKFLKDKSNKNWEAYRKQRNLVTKLEKQSIRTYFYERCVGRPQSTDFYPTIKPFLTNKGSKITKDIILEDNNKIINDQLQVANNFNNFFINVAKDIGNDNNVYAEVLQILEVLPKCHHVRLLFLNLLYLFALIQNHFQFHEILIYEFLSYFIL